MINMTLLLLVFIFALISESLYFVGIIHNSKYSYGLAFNFFNLILFQLNKYECKTKNIFIVLIQKLNSYLFFIIVLIVFSDSLKIVCNIE